MSNAGIILCGGRSRRMGADKAWLPVEGTPCLARIVATILESLDHAIVVKHEGQLLPVLPSSVTVIVDSVPDQGPLRGLRDGLRSLPGDLEAVFLTGCDTPFLAGAVARLAIALLGDAEIAVPFVEGRMNPLCAAYRPSVAAKAERLLNEGRYKMGFLLEECEKRVIGEAELRAVDPELRSFINLNTREDYAAIAAANPFASSA